MSNELLWWTWWAGYCINAAAAARLLSGPEPQLAGLINALVVVFLFFCEPERA